MTELARQWEPDWAVPAGEILAEALDERGMSQSELARRTNRPVKTINEIVKGKAAITPDTALQLELVLDIRARFWLNVERRCAEWQARERELSRLEASASWSRRFPLEAMVRHGMIAKADSDVGYVRALLRFFAVTSPTAWERQWMSTETAFRRSPAFRQSPEPVSAWLRWGEVQARHFEVKPFDAQVLFGELPALRPLTRLEPIAFVEPMRERLARAGVIVVLTPELPGTHLSGAARWLANDRVVVQLSMRHRTDDFFWFAFFHEIRHAMRLGPRRSFLDASDQPRVPDELDADRFSRDWLVPAKDFAEFVEVGDLSPPAIEKFAKRLGVSSGIVVGRLQHERLLTPRQLNHLKRRFHWVGE